MRITSVQIGASSIEQAASSLLFKQAAQQQNLEAYNQWLQENAGLIKQFTDTTTKMLSGNFMRNRPTHAKNMNGFLAMLYPERLSDPRYFEEVVKGVNYFDADLKDVYDTWQNSISTLERQKNALQNYLGLWDQVKKQIAQGKAIMTGQQVAPKSQAAPQTAPAQAPPPVSSQSVSPTPAQFVSTGPA